jgi:hypothetical protein
LLTFKVDRKLTVFQEEEFVSAFKGILAEHNVLVDIKDYPGGQFHYTDH